MKEDLKEIKGEGGASDGSKDEEMKRYSLKNYPKKCSDFILVNADGERDEKGEHICWSVYYDFKTWVRVRLEPNPVIAVNPEHEPAATPRGFCELYLPFQTWF